MTAHVRQQRQRTMFTSAEIDSTIGVLTEAQVSLLREAATGKNYKEIGLALGIPRMKVSAKLNQARSAISRTLEHRKRAHQSKELAYG